MSLMLGGVREEILHGRGAFHPNRGVLLKVVGQCDTADKYGHDYLRCRQCKVNKNTKCFIGDCPCLGQGYLFPVQNDPKCFSHQIPGHVDSVRIYLNRPARTLISIKKSIEKNEKILNKKNSFRRHRSNIAERILNGTFKRRAHKSIRDGDKFNSSTKSESFNSILQGSFPVGSEISNASLCSKVCTSQANEETVVAIKELDSIPFHNILSSLEQYSDDDGSGIFDYLEVEFDKMCNKRKRE